MKRWTILLLVCALFLGTSTGIVYAETEREANCLAPSVITEVKTFQQYKKAIEDQTDVILFSVNENGNAAFDDANDVAIDALMSDFETVVPGLRVSSEAQADKVSEILRAKNSDKFFIVSDNGQLINRVKKAFPRIRGVFDATQCKNINESNAYDLTTEVAKSDCQVVLVNSGVSSKAVYKIQAKSILVWCAAENEKSDIIDGALKGCFGIVGSDAAAVQEALSIFGVNAFLSQPYIVGHRGAPQEYNENSVESVEEAYKNGATHTEIDIHLTADNEVVVMHDGTLDRTTNGSGDISCMDLSEIQQFKIDINKEKAGLSEIPVLADMFDVLRKEEFNEKILIVEFKSEDPNIVTQVQKLVERYTDIRSRIMFITSNRTILTSLYKAMPDITRGFLGMLNSDNFRFVLSPINAFIDSSMSSPMSGEECVDLVKNYGYSMWGWTLDTLGDALSGIKQGYSGLTINNVGDFSRYIKQIQVLGIGSEQDEMNCADVRAICYNGTRKEVDAAWIRVDKSHGMFVYTFEDENDAAFKADYYTQLIETETDLKDRALRKTDQKSGCGSSFIGLNVFGAVGILCSSIILFKKKRIG